MIGQLILDNAKLTPGHITSMFVVPGAALDIFNLYDKVGDKVKAIEEKTISKHLNTPVFDVDELDVVEFKFYLREAFIYNSSLTEEGIEYLRNAKRLETTDHKRNKLRKKMNKG